MTRYLLGIVLAALPAVTIAGQGAANDQAPVVVASKPFAESYLLAEMFAQVLEASHIKVDRRPGLGSTDILFSAIRSGSVDVYPEYTGTGLIAIMRESLPADERADAARVFARVADVFATRYGIRWLPPLGFENTFAIAVRKETADALNLRSLSDLARQSSKLTAGFSPDFVERSDGLAGLATIYGEAVRPQAVKPLLSALKYQAVANHAVDVIDAYSTDGLLERYNLVVLEDDRHFFPAYQAAALLGPRAARRQDIVAALATLSGRLDVRSMRSLNRRVEVDGEDVSAVAASALQRLGVLRLDKPTVAATERDQAAESFAAYVWSRRGLLARLTMRHLWLSAIALAAAAMIALPIGLALERLPRLAGPVLGGLGVLQTIPSIALLAFMVPFAGIGIVPALIALWVYALFPIARGTYTGVRDADPAAVEAAEALGMTARQRLLQVRLPLASPVILAGLRTAAVITIGATTLAAFVGAGGLGEPIVTGLAIADTRMVLLGAVPAAVLTLLVDGTLAWVERLLRPAHLRQRPT